MGAFVLQSWWSFFTMLAYPDSWWFLHLLNPQPIPCIPIGTDQSADDYSFFFFAKKICHPQIINHSIVIPIARVALANNPLFTSPSRLIQWWWWLQGGEMPPPLPYPFCAPYKCGSTYDVKTLFIGVLNPWCWFYLKRKQNGFGGESQRWMRDGAWTGPTRPTTFCGLGATPHWLPSLKCGRFIWAIVA